MSWVNLKLQDYFDVSDLLCFKTILKCKGALDVAFENKLGEYLSDELDTLINTSDKLKITALFDDIATATVAKNFLFNAFKLASNIEDTINKTWQQKVIYEFQPAIYANKLCIHPSWKSPPENIPISICIDARDTFGSSTHPHPSTSLCLEWLITEPSIVNSCMLDYGCGSGILSIAAVISGAKHVIATDIDPKALEETNKNAITNNIIKDQLQTYLPDQLPEIKADLIVANITANSLIQIKSTLASLTKPNANILLCGFPAEDSNKIIDEFAQIFKLKSQVTKNNWALLIFQANG